MYLPIEIPDAHVLIVVKTYPLPSKSYVELVCTAGLLDGKWVRIYPIASAYLRNEQHYPKYSWIELNLIRKSSDFRPESYSPRMGIDENIKVIGKIGTSKQWTERKCYVLDEVHMSMTEIIELAKSNTKKSLATLKPKEIIDLKIEATEREWKNIWLEQRKQGDFFEIQRKGTRSNRQLIRKVPFKYSYKFISEGDVSPREMQIMDWEIGALFWNCLKKTKDDEEFANELVKQKYLHDFRNKKDIYFFIGTTQKYHNISRNPFIIIGVFYPPKTTQLRLL